MPLTEMVLERDFVDMDTIDKWITPGILLLLGFLYHIFGETEEDVAILTSALNHSALHRRPRTLSTSVCLKKESGYPHTTHFQAIEFELPSVRHMFTAMLIGLFVTVSIFDFASFVL
jgi:hypothetical protein